MMVKLPEKLPTLFDLRPAVIIKRFGLKNPIFLPTAAYGHMGREPYHAKSDVDEKWFIRNQRC